jgi:hypothetical protein
MNLLQRVRKRLEVHNDCVHCESLPTISNVILYHSSRMQCLIIRPSRAFVVSVNLHRTSGEALLSEAHRLFPSSNRTDKIQFSKQYCDLRVLIDTKDLHPTYQRFKPIAQQSIENIFFSSATNNTLMFYGYPLRLISYQLRPITRMILISRITQILKAECRQATNSANKTL